MCCLRLYANSYVADMLWILFSVALPFCFFKIGIVYEENMLLYTPRPPFHMPRYAADPIYCVSRIFVYLMYFCNQFIVDIYCINRPTSQSEAFNLLGGGSYCAAESILSHVSLLQLA